jgi:hypothetical protein
MHEKVSEDLTKVEASEESDRLKEKTRRGQRAGSGSKKERRANSSK